MPKPLGSRENSSGLNVLVHLFILADWWPSVRLHIESVLQVSGSIEEHAHFCVSGLAEAEDFLSGRRVGPRKSSS